MHLKFEFQTEFSVHLVCIPIRLEFENMFKLVYTEPSSENGLFFSLEMFLFETIPAPYYQPSFKLLLFYSYFCNKVSKRSQFLLINRETFESQKNSTKIQFICPLNKVRRLPNNHCPIISANLVIFYYFFDTNTIFHRVS